MDNIRSELLKEERSSNPCFSWNCGSSLLSQDSACLLHVGYVVHHLLPFVRYIDCADTTLLHYFMYVPACCHLPKTFSLRPSKQFFFYFWLLTQNLRQWSLSLLIDLHCTIGKQRGTTPSFPVSAQTSEHHVLDDQ